MTSLRIGNYPGGKLRRALLRFNLASIPTSATIVKATLKLHILDVFQGADRVRVHRATGTWEEGTATWTNFPSCDLALAAVASVNDTMIGTQIQIDVTKTAQGWVSNPTTNRGCMLQGTNTPSLRGALFGSQEHADGAKRPKLVVEYTP